MTKQEIIARTVNATNLLPPDKAEEISDFADFLSKRFEEHELTQGLQKLAANSHAFGFLENEEDLYSVAHLKEVYNA